MQFDNNLNTSQLVQYRTGIAPIRIIENSAVGSQFLIAMAKVAPEKTHLWFP
jgi:hypothetical protein